MKCFGSIAALETSQFAPGCSISHAETLELQSKRIGQHEGLKVSKHAHRIAEAAKASEWLAGASKADRGAIFTRPQVVELILDLIGYMPSKPLSDFRILEPSAGHGDFLLPIIRRLVKSHGKVTVKSFERLRLSVSAFEIHLESVETARRQVVTLLVSLGVSSVLASKLAEAWIRQGDFLLTDIQQTFTHVAGNPPYVRQEQIPEGLLRQYRAQFKTFYDRADMYVPFFEKGLSLLAPEGVLAFICTDRWTKNKYGGPLRSLISRDFALTQYVDLVDTPAFLADVMTYPSIAVIRRTADRPETRICYRPSLDSHSLEVVAKDLTAKRLPKGSSVYSFGAVVDGDQPWLLSNPARVALVRRLEAAMPTIEEAGCKVGIGVATGNDSVYIGPLNQLDVEDDRKLPLVRTQDIRGGAVVWGGMGVLNPFEADGSVVDLGKYPKFAKYVQKNVQVIKDRNVAKRNPERWFRTIDRIYPELVKVPKLLIPDIKGSANIVFEPGLHYPHHNLYYVISTDWDLRALQSVLTSGIARLFVATYCTEMRGGFLRFQAQYLRRIRIPLWKNVPRDLRSSLRRAAETGDVEAANVATYVLFGLSAEEQEIVAAL